MINKLILTIIYLLISGCSSCDSNPPTSYTPIAGCTDQNANNYSSSANIDDGSCTYLDSCNHPIKSLWFVTNSDGTWGIGYNSNTEIGGFQFDIENATIINVSGGVSAENNFMVSPSGNRILGFSLSGAFLPSGVHILTILELDGTPTNITNRVISDASGEAMDFIFDDSCFSINLADTGTTQLTIFSSSITTLEVGDQIGIFDANGIKNYNDCSNQYGELLVGSAFWTGEQISPVSIGSVDMCAFGGVQLAGYVEGNLVLAKVYRPSTGVEYNAELVWDVGTGKFGDIIQSVSEISLSF
jgi:hypothetical protein